MYIGNVLTKEVQKTWKTNKPILRVKLVQFAAEHFQVALWPQRVDLCPHPRAHQGPPASLVSLWSCSTTTPPPSGQTQSRWCALIVSAQSRPAQIRSPARRRGSSLPFSALWGRWNPVVSFLTRSQGRTLTGEWSPYWRFHMYLLVLIGKVIFCMG
jgi:hypothetical protein